MAQNVTVAGASYSAVPSVDLPTTGGGTSSFYDVSDTTATASDVAQGNVFYDATGALTTGTASGGGSDDPYPVRNDGKTHLWVVVDDMAQPNVTLYFKQSPANGIIIDWGDGTVESAGNSTGVHPSHSYDATGTYEVMLYPASSSAFINFNTWTTTSLCLMGNTSVSYYHNLGKLRAAELNNFDRTGNTAKTLAANAFRNCISLEKVTIIGTFSSVSFIKIYTPYALREVTVPDTLTSFSLGSSEVQYPNLRVVNLPSGDSSIGSNVFNDCWSLQSVTIPAAVTTIGASAFANCYSLASITFLPTTPPTVADATAWTNLPTTCEIHVPTGTLADYTAAANYPDPATYTYIED